MNAVSLYLQVFAVGCSFHFFLSSKVTTLANVLPVPQIPFLKHASCTICEWSMNKFARAP